MREALVSRRVVRVSCFVSFELLLLADDALGLFGEAIMVIRVGCVFLTIESTMIAW